MNTIARMLTAGLLGAGLAAYGQTQPSSNASAQTDPHPPRHHRSPGGDVGSGAGDVGKGAGKGAGSLAKGTGKGAADLATLHPLNAAGDIGRGGASAGKHVGVGAAKGTGKIAKGTGRAVKKIF